MRVGGLSNDPRTRWLGDMKLAFGGKPAGGKGNLEREGEEREREDKWACCS